MTWIVLAAMASHFSMIGFTVSEADATTMSADFSAYSRHCEPRPLAADSYTCLVRDPSGAELWIGLKKTAETNFELSTANPAFTGEGRMRVVIDGDRSRPEWKPFEITLQAHFGSEKVPFVFDLADPREATRFSPKATLTIDLTAFADELSVHDSEADYYASQDDRKVKFAANHFIPSGMFGDETSKGPTAHAMFAGRIVKSELRQNVKGKGRYWWFLVQTLDDAVINVVADAETVKVTPRVGGHLAGSFWLSARLSPSR